MSAGVIVNASALERLLQADEGPAATALYRVATRVENTAKRLCPVDTGRLRASITTVMGKGEAGLVAYVGSDVQYAIYQEMGTRYMSAQPYLRPALAAVQAGAFRDEHGRYTGGTHVQAVVAAHALGKALSGLGMA